MLLSACARLTVPLPTPTLPPTSTPLPTATPAPLVTPEPAPILTGLEMFPEGGWAWNYNTGSLYRSTDAGASWKRVSLPSGEIFNFSASAFLDLNTVWLAGTDQLSGGQKLFRTTDGGSVWALTLPEGLDSLAGNFTYHFTSPRVGWAEAAEGGAGNLYVQVFKTLTGGATYQVVPIQQAAAVEALPEGTLHLCNICADSFYYDPARVMILTGDMGSMQPRGSVEGMSSFDGGRTWEEIRLPLPPSYKDALVTPLSPAFVDDTHGFLPVALTRLEPEGSTPRSALALYTSADGGRNWTPAAATLEDMPNYPALQFINATDAVAQGAEALHMTRDAGNTWETRPLPPEMVPNDSRSLFDLDFTDAQTGWLILSEYSAGVTSYKTWKTEDGAKTWTLQ